MPSVRRSIALVTASHYAAQAIGITSIMVLSRLLSPKEIGVFSIGTAVLALIHVFRDFGISSYLIREPELTPEKIGTCYVFSVGIAWLSGVALLLATPMVARLYGEPGLTSVLYVLLAGLFIVPFNSIRIALLRRDMRFDILLWAELASAAANALTAIGLAWLGFGFVSLAWGGLASLLATMLATAWRGSTQHRARASIAEWRSVGSFGGMALTLNMIIRSASQAPMLIVGKLVDMQATGLLSRAMGLGDILLSVAQQTLGNAIFSDVSRKMRLGHEIGSDYLRAVTYLIAVAVPASLFLMVLARPVLHVMFGPAWEDAATLVRIFCVATLFLPFTVFNGSFLTASGRIDQQLRIEATFSPFKAAVWLLVVPFDLPTAASAYVALHVLSLATSTTLLAPIVGVGRAQVLACCMRVLPIALCALMPALALALLEPALLQSRPLRSLLLAGAAGGLAWLGALFVFGHPLASEARRLFATVRAHRNPRRAP